MNRPLRSTTATNGGAAQAELAATRQQLAEARDSARNDALTGLPERAPEKRASWRTPRTN